MFLTKIDFAGQKAFLFQMVVSVFLIFAASLSILGWRVSFIKSLIVSQSSCVFASHVCLVSVTSVYICEISASAIALDCI